METTLAWFIICIAGLFVVLPLFGKAIIGTKYPLSKPDYLTCLHFGFWGVILIILTLCVMYALIWASHTLLY